MFLVTSVTDDARQKFSVPLETGETVTFRLYYYPTQYSWYFDFEYKNHISNGNKVVLSPNTLRQYQNIMPFGVAFIADGNVEPFMINDFSTGRVNMYILNQEEVQTIEEEIYTNE